MLNELVLGLTLGTLLGLSYFALTLWHIYRGKGPVIHFMGHHLIGYRRSFKGAIVSLVWGFFLGFVTGVLIAFLYNFYFQLLNR